MSPSWAGSPAPRESCLYSSPPEVTWVFHVLSLALAASAAREIVVNPGAVSPIKHPAWQWETRCRQLIFIGIMGLLDPRVTGNILPVLIAPGPQDWDGDSHYCWCDAVLIED